MVTMVTLVKEVFRMEKANGTYEKDRNDGRPNKGEGWLVSVMMGHGRNAQFFMTERMTYDKALSTANRFVENCEDGIWIRVDRTFVNPKNVNSIRVLHEKEGLSRRDSQ